MLIIAQPKSASTSLTKTIAEIAKLKYRLGMPKTTLDINCDGYEEIQKYHDNMIERTPVFLEQIIKGRRIIFKEHLLPTNRHFRILNKFKENILLLLRDSEETIDAYKRHKEIHDKKNPVKLNIEKISEDIRLFHDRWMYYASNRKNVLLIEYKDLVLNYNNTMKKILKHFKLNGNIKPLRKDRFTGIGEKRLVNNSNS